VGSYYVVRQYVAIYWRQFLICRRTLEMLLASIVVLAVLSVTVVAGAAGYLIDRSARRDEMKKRNIE
jgi:hypothetical protein